MFVSSCFLTTAPSLCSAQSEEFGQPEEQEVAFRYARRYLDLNIRSLDKYTVRLKRQQSRMLSRLARKETRVMARIEDKDSAAYARLRSQGPSFDSLSTLACTNIRNASEAVNRGGIRVLPTIDSLNRIEEFLQSKTQGSVSNAIGAPSEFAEKLKSLNNELSYRKQIEKWSLERMAILKSSLCTEGGSITGLKSMEKTAFYASSRIKAYRELAESPSKLEEKALEYLQGAEGFEKALKRPTASSNAQTLTNGNSQQGANIPISATDLEKMGFQTKQGLQRHFQEGFGSQLSGVKQQVGSQLKDYKGQVTSVSDQIRQAKQSIEQTGGTKRLSFGLIRCEVFL
jgi:hypothetical protein